MLLQTEGRLEEERQGKATLLDRHDCIWQTRVKASRHCEIFTIRSVFVDKCIQINLCKKQWVFSDHRTARSIQS
jgi:hypothetical protein